MPSAVRKLLILGVHLSTEAYPNTLYRLKALKQSERFKVTEINFPMSKNNFGKIGGLFRKISTAIRSLVSHFVVVARYVFSEKADIVYVPYPAVFVVFMLSCLPGRLRPRRVIMDTFISLYDTIVTDRHLLDPEGVFARILYRVEKRAYRFAAKVIVDTPQSASFLCKLFDLDPKKVLPIPLATDEDSFHADGYLPVPGICKVLFVGTLVPLHGIETILGAAAILSDRKDIVFRIIGDGQDATKIEQWQRGNDIPLVWTREWQSSAHVAEEIRQSDICLGIFGSGEKTQRVCPFKIYAYAAVGRSIITGDTTWSRAMSGLDANRFFETVPVGDSAALAEKIMLLSNDPELRKTLAGYSRKFYERQLSNELGNRQLEQCMLEL